MAHTPHNGSVLSESLQQAVRSANEQQIAQRIWNRDANLWKPDAAARASINNRLGWLEAPDHFLTKVKEIEDFVSDVREDGITDVVLLGMGGSSLCVEVIRDTFGVSPGYPQMHVLDSTHPDQVLRTERSVNLAHTLFIVASKSGTTLESDSFFNYFWSKVAEHSSSDDRQGSHFVAITDPGTVLESLALTARFRKVFVNPPDIGGRFSALSYFGLVPAALMGVDITELLSRAASEASLSRSDDDSNLALALGVFLHEGLKRGKDKLTLVTEQPFTSFGYWAEQLVAESTGKEGKGILPIEGESPLPPEAVSNDRIIVHITSGENADASGGSDDHLDLHAEDAYGLGEQFFRWEFATAVVGALMGINPFDEPNVAESKAQTNRVLSQFDGRTPLTFPDVAATIEGLDVAGSNVSGDTLAAAISNFIDTSKKDHGYIAIMAYLDRSDENMAALARLRTALEIHYTLPVTVGFGPRFLHSTGQLHKGGPDTGVFLQLIDKPKEDVLVATKHYTFGTLVLGQAIGDYEALRAKSKPVLTVNLGSDPVAMLQKIAGAL